MNSSEALREIMDYEGYEDEDEFMNAPMCDELDYPGICLACGLIHRIEQDVFNGICQECGLNQVCSATMLYL